MLTNFDIRKVSRNIAKPFIEKYHYTKSIGKVSVAYGLFDTNKTEKIGFLDECKLVGIITYGQVSSRDLAQSIFEGGNQYNTLEFLRMAVLDDCNCPRSLFISKTVKMLRNYFPGIKCLVSFADQTEGHFGYVYQASNWIYCGVTSKKYHYLLNGKRINKRMVFDKAKSLKMTEKEYVEKFSYIKKPELPKFRYIYLLDKDIRLKLEILPYPKRGSLC